ncbi:MAG: hypothetical protein ACTSR0_03380 [Candidatus Asgardarchaeia archaeon]
MSGKKYLYLILIYAWTTFILILVLIDLFVLGIEIEGSGYIYRFIESLLKIVISGTLFVIWLYSWNKMAKYYFFKIRSRM